MYDNFTVEEVSLNFDFETSKIQTFLEVNHLIYEQPVDYTIRVIDHSSKIVGTGSVLNNIIKCVAVDPDYRESVVFSKIISHLLEYLAAKTIQHCFVFTKPASVQSFVNLGFTEIERAEPLFALLEYGTHSIQDYKTYLQLNQHSSDKPKKVGALVMNCNPFTLGHRYVIEEATKYCDVVYVFVVEEDRSSFPFDVRFDLIQRGVSDLKNVIVLKGGDYIISSSTFPTYFLKNENPGEIERLQTELDVRIFARHIAPTLGITHRFVGTEDYCKTTSFYNHAMENVLPEFGIQLHVINRNKTDDDLIVSASHVRTAIKDDNWELIQQLVPKTTYDFLKSDAAKSLISSIKQSQSRH
jgi:[citrate (pro-3S)-lyase] ligase